MRAQVVRAHDVVLDVLRRLVLDQIQLRTVGRERVEGERPLQGDLVTDPEIRRAQQDELRRVRRTDALQDEGAAVAEHTAAGPLAVDIGTPNEPGMLCDNITTDPPLVLEARTTVDSPAPTATKRIEPSVERTPWPPWSANGAGYAAEATDTTASAPRTVR